MPRKLIFADMDGTLIHGSTDALRRCGTLSEDGRSFHTLDGTNIATRPLPPSSSTGSQSFISEKTLQLVTDIRRAGHLFVHITAARSSSFLERLAWLPAADAYVFECGGRIFLPSDERFVTAAPIVEDLEWRKCHEAAPMVLESVPPPDRPGILWEFCSQLQKDGWACDTKQYYTCFRIVLTKSKDKSTSDLEKVISNLPPQLACSFNLGMADIYPSSSGKENAGAYLMKKFGFAREDSISMGDDDNDLALAEIMSHTYIVGFTSASVRKAVEANPLKFTVAKQEAFQGTHEVLEKMKELPI